MRKLLFAVPLLALLLLAGCAESPASSLFPASEDAGDFSSEGGLALYGSRVTITDLYPGFTGEMEFEVVNRAKDNVTREIRLSIEPEDDADLGEGWVQLPAEYYRWFTINKPEFTLEPGESQAVIVTVAMPADADYSGKRARCELLVMGWTVVGTTTDEYGETVNVVGNVPIGLASEWYIETY